MISNPVAHLTCCKFPQFTTQIRNEFFLRKILMLLKKILFLSFRMKETGDDTRPQARSKLSKLGRWVSNVLWVLVQLTDEWYFVL